MATTEDNDTSITIGIPGYYKVSVRFGLNTSWGSCLNHELKLNGTRIAFAITHHSHSNNFDEILNLKRRDKLSYVVSSTVSNNYWDVNCNNFSLEYLGKRLMHCMKQK
eukprot:UN03444